MAKKARTKQVPLYLLTPDYDAKGYCPWNSLEGVGSPKRYSQYCETTPLAKTWKKFTATFEKEKKQGAFMFAGGYYFALPTAFEAVKKFLGDAVEGLPVKVKGGGPGLDLVYLLHSLVTADLAVRAVVKLYPNGKIMRVERYAFDHDQIAEKHFFFSHGATIVSDEFRTMIEDAKLSGLGFKPLRGYED